MRRALLATAVLLALTIGSSLEAEARGGASLTVNPAQPHYGDKLTFTVETSTSQPYVSVWCLQAGSLWFSETHPYFGPTYPESATFTLPQPVVSNATTSCTARLYKLTRNGGRLLAETTFTIQP